MSAVMYVAATPLNVTTARRMVDEIFDRAVGDATPLAAEVREIAAAELVALSNAVNWRELVAQGLSIPALITILMTLLPVFIKNTTVLDFIKTLIDQFLPLFS